LRAAYHDGDRDRRAGPGSTLRRGPEGVPLGKVGTIRPAMRLFGVLTRFY